MRITAKPLCAALGAVLALGFAPAQADDASGWIDLLEDAQLAAWREPTGDWFIAGDALLDPLDEERLAAEPGLGVAINGVEGKTNHFVSKHEHGDVELHLEFMVPKGSNSGVYLQGRYEIQILDSWGVEDPGFYDCGGIYQRWREDETPEGERAFLGIPPRVNASKAPGEWQRYEITFKAPRFDADGKKFSDAEFIKVVHNGIVIHENEPVTGPTRAAMFKDEQPKGPLMLQGDHGPVAYRNIRLREIELKD